VFFVFFVVTLRRKQPDHFAGAEKLNGRLNWGSVCLISRSRELA
jgi:hypothetical protein